MFWKALPDTGFGERVKQCKGERGGGVKSKQRHVTFIVNGAGKSETKPVMIWKSENLDVSKG